jgi:hypothetical protein
MNFLCSGIFSLQMQFSPMSVTPGVRGTPSLPTNYTILLSKHGQAPPISLLCLEIQMHFQTEGFCMVSSQQKPEHQGLQSHDQHGLIAFTKPFSWNVWKKRNTKVSQQCLP